MMIKYLLILGIGHLLGDFYLQNEKIASNKDRNFQGVLLHAAEYWIAFLIPMIPVLSVDMLLAATYAGLCHFFIDSVKYFIFIKRIGKKNYKVFVLDQVAHVLSIVFLAFIMENWNFIIGDHLFVIRVLSAFHYDLMTVGRWTFCILLLHNPVNIFIQNFLREYKPHTDGGVIKADNKAGRKIGTIERLIMLIFLSKDQFSALGFVLTAKSIARYDRITKDEKFAEYYLLGTLVSTLCVIVCRLLIL